MAGERDDIAREAWIERMPLGARRPWQSLAITFGIVALAFALRFALNPAIPSGSPFITFFPAVLLVSFLFGVRLGIVAALLSTALGALFFMSDPMAKGYFLTAVPSAVAFVILVTLNLILFHWMQTANAKLRKERARSAALAKTRETLFRELQHRVSNNLQVAAGLLALQKKHVADDVARGALDETSRRLEVIGRISRQLYDPDGAARSMRAFLASLCVDVVEMSGRDGVTISVEADQDVQLAPDAAVPLALIVAEAAANAIEHGFADREEGSIAVMLTHDAAGARVVDISDDGKGLPPGFDLGANAGLGLGIVRTLAVQLGGHFTLVPGPRTIARLTVPLHERG
jgi:two-component sensor histidine kinase